MIELVAIGVLTFTVTASLSYYGTRWATRRTPPANPLDLIPQHTDLRLIGKTNGEARRIEDARRYKRDEERRLRHEVELRAAHLDRLAENRDPQTGAVILGHDDNPYGQYAQIMHHLTDGQELVADRDPEFRSATYGMSASAAMWHDHYHHLV